MMRQESRTPAFAGMMKRGKIMLRFAVPFAGALSLASCASADLPAERTVAVTGSIAHRERIALPPTAQIEVRLDDVSLADAPVTNMATQSFASEGRQAPFAFTLTLDHADIAQQMWWQFGQRAPGGRIVQCRHAVGAAG